MDEAFITYLNSQVSHIKFNDDDQLFYATDWSGRMGTGKCLLAAVKDLMELPR